MIQPPPGLWYILDENKNVVECRNYPEIEKQISAGRKFKHVRATHVHAGSNRFWVSTVFLFLDHGAFDKKLFFETMVFQEFEDKQNLTIDDCMLRYETYDQAVKGHKKLCRFIKQHKLNKLLRNTNKELH